MPYSLVVKMERSHPLSFGTVSVLQKGGSLQITVPADLAKILGLRVGDEVKISFDPVAQEIIVSRQLTRIVRRKEAEVLYLLQRVGVYLRRNHYGLASGKHSRDYAHIRLACAHKDVAEQMGRAIVEQINSDQIDAVAGFTVGGLLLARAIATILNAKLIIGEKVFPKERPSEVVFYNLNEIEKAERILLVDDVLTTGGSLKLAIGTIFKKSQGVLAAVAVVADRGQEMIDLGVNVLRLTSIDFVEYDPEVCPMCKEGLGLVDLSKAEIDEEATLSTLPESRRPVMAKGYHDVREMVTQAKSK